MSAAEQAPRCGTDDDDSEALDLVRSDASSCSSTGGRRLRRLQYLARLKAACDDETQGGLPEPTVPVKFL